MKSIIPDPEQLDALAAGLDAGWDEEPAETSPSQPPRSASVAPDLAALDADWEVEAPASVASEEAAARNLPFRASKRERRDAERQRRAHQAQQRSASKEQRKAERLAEARKATERQRAAEQQAEAARKKQAKPRKRKPSPAAGEPGASPKRAVARARREQAAPVRAASVAAAPSAPLKPTARPVDAERPWGKLVVLLALATVFALSLWFALSRAR